MFFQPIYVSEFHSIFDLHRRYENQVQRFARRYSRFDFMKCGEVEIF